MGKCELKAIHKANSIKFALSCIEDAEFNGVVYMIAILDYGMGNVGSVLNMLKKIDAEAVITRDSNIIEQADKIILPGVGSFDTGMKKLAEYGLISVIQEHVIKNQKPILGICLGMQMLGRCSEEGRSKGLNLIPFDNIRFRFQDDTHLKIPHMGWNRVTKSGTESALLDGLDAKQRYYFVHSYHAVCDNKNNVLLQCEYGYTFAAAIVDRNIYGVQFHPEKSHRFGISLLDNFARKC